MNHDPGTFATELARLLQAEPELFGQLEIEGQVVSGALGHEHPMAWRCLNDLEAVETRLEKLPERAVRDRDLTGVVQSLD